MKKLITIIIITSLFACGNTDNPEAIKTQIKEYKAQVSDLENKISELEQSLD